MTSARNAVQWFGTPPSAAEILECERRSLSVRVGADSSVSFWDTRAVVVAFGPDQSEGRRLLIAVAERARNEGASVFARTTLSFHPIHKHIVDQLQIAPPVLVSADDPWSFAETLRSSPSQQPANSNLEIHGDYKPADAFLLRRAFFDSTDLQITTIVGGKSGSTYGISAWGPNNRPLPFFAKADERAKCERERVNYDEHVARYVPFFARPNLARERCSIGAHRGLLVYDLVEHAETLSATASRSSAQSAIYSLFDHALRGWRHPAGTDNSGVVSDAFLQHLGEDFFNPAHPISAERFGIARRLGGQRTEAQMFDRLGGTRCGFRAGRIHGDLHAKNVMVRGSEAVLVDFGSIVNHAPLSIDAASLEVSLAFEDDTLPHDFRSWRRFIAEVYSRKNLDGLPFPEPRHPDLQWRRLWSSIRQIRLLAQPLVERGEYAMAAICALLRHSRREAHGRTTRAVRRDDQRRALAYATADRLLREVGQ